MASYGWISSVPILFIAAMPHGIMEAVQSPGSQAAVSDAAPIDDAAAAQGLGEAMGSAASMVGALTASVMAGAQPGEEPAEPSRPAQKLREARALDAAAGGGD